MKVLNDSFEKISSFEWLEQAYRCARRGKRYRDDILLFSENMDLRLMEIQEQLRSGAFVIGPYRHHWVYSPKRRRVTALPFASRIVQWAIYSELNPFYDKLFIEDSYGCRDGKGSLAAACRLQYWLSEAQKKRGSWYIIKLDISKYFYRIDHSVLKSILAERITDKKLLALLYQIIDTDVPFGLPRGADASETPESEWLYDVGMPIGSLTSQLYANIYLDKADQYAKHKLHIHRYARYMDDIVAVTDSLEAARKYFDAMRSYLSTELRLDLNQKSCIFPAHRSVEYVGYIVTPRELRLRKATIRRIKRAHHAICYKLASGMLPRESFDRRIASYKGLMAPCSTDALQVRLSEIYKGAVERGGYKCLYTSDTQA